MYVHKLERLCLTLVRLLQDVKYVDEKLRDLMNIAEEGIGSLERQARELEANITKLEEIREDEQSSVGYVPDIQLFQPDRIECCVCWLGNRQTICHRGAPIQQHHSAGAPVLQLHVVATPSSRPGAPVW
jgi:hypothetical protein